MRDKQIILDKLCEKYCVPKIPVKFQQTEKMGDNYAYFDNVEYIIYYGSDCEDETMIHEFCHYLIYLIGRLEEVEEDICDIFMNKLKKEKDIKRIFEEAEQNEPRSEKI